MFQRLNATDVPVSFIEIHGRVKEGAARPVRGDLVILSNLEHASVLSAPLPGVCVRFVGRGREGYRISGRGIGLNESQFMVSSHAGGAECEVPKGERAGTLGLCIFLSPSGEEMEWPCGPMVFAKAANKIGAVLERYTKTLLTSVNGKRSASAYLTRELRTFWPGFLKDVVARAAAVDAVKLSTRFEMLRRANLAQAYLHAVVDRRVNLSELACASGTSQFRLLQAFQSCFGESPARYHRRLRLELAKNAANRTGITLENAAEAFGFAGGSSFSHAHRRTLGEAPVWSKRG